MGCLEQMRREGVGVALIGATRGEMVGAQGVVMCPDLSLDEVEKFPVPQLLIIPGGQEALNGLMIEPRIHRLVKTALQKGKLIGLGRGAENFISSHDIQQYSISKNQVIYQEGAQLEGFIQQLTLHLNFPMMGPNPSEEANLSLESPEIG